MFKRNYKFCFRYPILAITDAHNKISLFYPFYLLDFIAISMNAQVYVNLQIQYINILIKFMC